MSMPHDLTAERALLGSCLLDNTKIDEVAEIVSADDFFHAGHRAAWRAMIALTEQGRASDAVTVADAMAAAGTLQEIDGVVGLVGILETVPHAAHARFYAEAVAGWAKRRNLKMIAAKLNSVSQDASLDTDEVVSKAVAMVQDVAESGVRSGPRTAKEVVDEVLSRPIASGMQTGFPAIDEVTYGLHREEMVILAARPSIGKTALAAAIAWNAARLGNTALVFSMEQPARDVIGRLISRETGIQFHKFRTGFDEFDRRQIWGAGEDLVNVPLFIDDSSGRTVAEVGAIARQIQRRHGLSLVVVDYLQLMKPEDKRVPREQQVSEISRGLKAIARNLKVSLIALAQLNRQSDLRASKIPVLADLRESGSLEQDGDGVWFIHRPNKDDPNPHQNPDDHALIVIAKNRNGPLGNVRIGWDGQYVSFFDPSSRPISESESNDFFDNGSQWR